METVSISRVKLNISELVNRVVYGIEFEYSGSSGFRGVKAKGVKRKT
jgi:hypothetical protein